MIQEYFPSLAACHIRSVFNDPAYGGVGSYAYDGSIQARLERYMGSLWVRDMRRANRALLLEAEMRHGLFRPSTDAVGVPSALTAPSTTMCSSFKLKYVKGL
ncbi:uncharacterized protein ARMOST_17004 [Armillaria ostoyae]|uniref:Uncharacterized protein n=1 Tax=Armillaria ostoyae TaxID=47428 RepID=A0A284RXT4_ARMOS|nr:uncharacterized protein ARMOST_17004 [Armillaria ostoyae]